MRALIVFLAIAAASPAAAALAPAAMPARNVLPSVAGKASASGGGAPREREKGSQRSGKPAEIYAAKCEKCHGPNGVSTEDGMSFAGREWLHGSDLKSIAKVITNGVPETGMNPFKDQLTPAEIQALAKYVRSLDKKLK
jgi:mono/diheme cytochrome c family protein